MKFIALDMKKFSSLLFISLLCCFSSVAQTKNEKETRITKDEFPKEALAILNTLPKEIKRIKYLKETDNDKESYEAKFKLNRKRYSVEFSENGILEDIEITIKKRELNKPFLEKLEHFFKTTYTKHSILKIQKQFVASSKLSSSDLLDLAVKNPMSPNTNYELIVEVKTESRREIKELTFNKDGELISQRIVVPSSYEHVLY